VGDTGTVMGTKRASASFLSGRLRSGWAAGVSAAALAVYLLTLAPGLTNANFGYDGGDLIAAARTLGVPHPSGYPTYTLLAWLFTHLPVGELAYRTNLLSAVCAAAAAGLFFCTAQRVLPAEGQQPPPRAGKRRPPAATGKTPYLLPAVTALMLAFSSLLWSQAVITEVYALLMLCAALLLWLLVRWEEDKRDHTLWAAALTLGLALGNHLTILFWAPAALVTLWPERRHWLRARTLLPAAGLFLAGLSVYAYLPLAASHRPPVNWGNPQTWRGFLWVVTGEQYQQFAFGLDLAEIPGRIAAWAGLLGDQFGWWGLPLALIGAWGQWRRDRRLALFSLVWIALVGVYAFFYDTADAHIYLLPAVMLMALWWGEGARLLLDLARTWRPAWRRAALAALLLMPLASLALHWRAVEPDDDGERRAFIDGVLEAAPPGGLIIARADQPTFALWYAIYAEGQRPDIQVVSGPMLAFIWYRDHVRHLYPGLVVREPSGTNLTWDDLVYDLIAGNTHLPTYLTDFKEEWRAWFEIAPVGDSPLYRVQVRRAPMRGSPAP
jgi:hypothetical protein